MIIIGKYDGVGIYLKNSFQNHIRNEIKNDFKI